MLTVIWLGVRLCWPDHRCESIYQLDTWCSSGRQKAFTACTQDKLLGVFCTNSGPNVTAQPILIGARSPDAQTASKSMPSAIMALLYCAPSAAGEHRLGSSQTRPTTTNILKAPSVLFGTVNLQVLLVLRPKELDILCSNLARQKCLLHFVTDEDVQDR